MNDDTPNADKLRNNYYRTKITKVLHINSRVIWARKRIKEMRRLIESETREPTTADNAERSERDGAKNRESVEWERKVDSKWDGDGEGETIILSIIVEVALMELFGIVRFKQNKYINYKAIVLRCKAIICLPFNFELYTETCIFVFGPSFVYTAEIILPCSWCAALLLTQHHTYVCVWHWNFHCPLGREKH